MSKDAERNIAMFNDGTACLFFRHADNLIIDNSVIINARQLCIIIATLFLHRKPRERTYRCLEDYENFNVRFSLCNSQSLEK